MDRANSSEDGKVVHQPETKIKKQHLRPPPGEGSALHNSIVTFNPKLVKSFQNILVKMGLNEIFRDFFFISRRFV